MSQNGSNKYLESVRNTLMAIPVIFISISVKAEDFTAGVVMQKMTAEERNAFLAGLAEGLAYARYTKDGKAMVGMKCIYDWFYADGTRQKIHTAFDKFADYQPGAVMAAMIEKECGA
jgi:hypothetical protein